MSQHFALGTFPSALSSTQSVPSRPLKPTSSHSLHALLFSLPSSLFPLPAPTPSKCRHQQILPKQPDDSHSSTKDAHSERDCQISGALVSSENLLVPELGEEISRGGGGGGGGARLVEEAWTGGAARSDGCSTIGERRGRGRRGKLQLRPSPLALELLSERQTASFEGLVRRGLMMPYGWDENSSKTPPCNAQPTRVVSLQAGSTRTTHRYPSDILSLYRE